MKKITLFIMLTMISAMVVNAQSTKTYKAAGELQQQKVQLDKQVVKERMEQMRAGNAKATDVRWLYAPDAVTNLFGGDWDGYAITLFPDTTMNRKYSDGTSGLTFFHSFAVTIDPFSSIYNLDPSTAWGPKESLHYTLDSIRIPGFYTRNTAASVVDTIVIQISNDQWSYNLSASDYSWVYDNFGVQQMSVPAVLHDNKTWESTAANLIQTIKIPLTEADSSANGAYIVDYAMPTPLQFNEGATFNMSVTFIPGYAYTPFQDTINNLNQFSFWTYEQMTGAFPTYLEDRNCSHAMNVWHYRDTTYDAYSPQYFYGADYSLEYHDVAVKLTALNVNIEDANETLTVGQNTPNPFDGTTKINYSLTNASDVMVEVYNVAGAKVMTVNEGVKAAGQHSLTIDGSALEAGVYYYTFTANGNRVTKKMIVW
jgi:hypothetical protein